MGRDCLFSVAMNHSFYIDPAIAGVCLLSPPSSLLKQYSGTELSCNLFNIYMQFL